MRDSLIGTLHSIGSLEIEIWSSDFAHAVSGHPEVDFAKVKATLEDPERVIRSKTSTNVCLFYSIEVRKENQDSIFFCVVVAVIKSGLGRLVTAYETDFLKAGKELFIKGI